MADQPMAQRSGWRLNGPVLAMEYLWLFRGHFRTEQEDQRAQVHPEHRCYRDINSQGGNVGGNARQEEETAPISI
jgi:hypothetical protein